jgi:Aminoglycoside-2''-adenylyltransferase
MSAETFAATPDNTRWEPLSPQQVAERLRGLAVPWWIAGGWALDLHLGHETRAHHDIEIAVYRGDEEAVRTHLRGWEFFIAESGSFTPWRDGMPLPKEAHELWSRERGHEAWQLEMLIEERAGPRWTYRRDPQVGLNARDLGRVSADGMPYVRPDVQLLYKSKQPRPSDETDFLTVLPRLDPAERAFLAAALWTVSPGHRWLERLK